MATTLNIWVIIYTCGLVMGVFMALLFILFRKRYSYHIHNITLILLVISLILFSEIAEESNLVDSYPSLLGLGLIVDLLIWPFFLFYVQFIVGKRSDYDWTSILYFIPFLLALISQIPFFILPEQSKLAYFSKGIPIDIALLVTFKLACIIPFIIHTFNTLHRTIIGLKASFPHSKKVEFLSKTKHFFTGISVVVLLIYSMFYIQYFDILPLGDSDRIGSLIVSSFTYFLAALIFKNPQLFQEENYSNQVKSFFKGTESKYSQDLLRLIESKTLYLNEKLSVNDVANAMGLTDQQLSYLLNRQLGVTFLDFINTFRVKEVQNRIQNEDHQGKTLLGLALESGFNSKASFNRIFKEHTGYSPSSYIKSLNK